MGKFFLFGILYWMLGNPLAALLVLIVIVYILDRRFVGLSPSLIRPLKRNRRLAAVRRELAASPHNTSLKQEAARILMEKKRWKEAADYLEEIRPIMDDSPEVLADLGICRLKEGQLAEGEALILESLEKNPRVKYGEPYLRLGEAFNVSDPDKALHYLRKFGEVNSSSCEAHYRQGQLYSQLGRKREAKEAYDEAVRLYRTLPKYKRKSERRWALLARLK